LLSAGIGALAIGFALGLRALAPGASASVPPKSFDSFDSWASFEFRHPDNQGLRVASLGTQFVLGSAAEDTDGRSELALSRPAMGQASFDERFAGAVDWPRSRSTVGTAEWANQALLSIPDPGGRMAARRAASPSARGAMPIPPLPPASAPRKQVRVADASASGDLGVPGDADEHTAIYDIVAQTVYLPNGQRLEAHSGMGSLMDDPRYVSEKDRGPTPPNVYDLTLREESFHGVQAIRLNPVGGGNMFGRAGMLAHTYMLGPNGQSNGCVSFSDYPAFLNAYLSGEINRLVVVEHLASAPSPKSATGWLTATIKAIFGRS
jgi:Tlde1 domain